MADADRPAADPTGPAPALAPSWAAPVAVVAFLVGALLAGLVWHATRLNPVDAWVMGWQERAYSHANGVAEIISGTLPAGVTLIVMVASAAVAWLAGRRDGVVLALTAAPAALVAEVLLKGLVHRTWNGEPAVLFPSGHVAVATAAAMTVVLVLRVVPVPPRARVVAALAVGFVLVVAVARLVETVHSLTDVVGGVSTGLVVTLGAAMAITAWFRWPHRRASSGASSRSTTRPPRAGAGQSRS